MSFSNDEDGDGLAALFGGITPQGAPSGEPGSRRAAREAAGAPESGDAPTPAPQDPPAYVAPTNAAPQYPGLAPEPYVAPYVPPAAAPASPAYEMPAPAQPPQAPQAYEMPAPAAPPPPPTYGAPVTPQYPGLAPAAPAYPPTAQYPASPSAPPPAASQPPAYQPPAYQPPADQPPADQAPVSRAPADQPPGYPPPGYQAPAYDPPPYDPPQRAEDPGPSVPEPMVEPPAFGGFEALGLQPTTSSGSGSPQGFGSAESLGSSDRSGQPDGYPAYAGFGGGVPVDEQPMPETPVAAPTPDHPLVRAEAAPLATVFPPGPLLPESTTTVESPEQLRRATPVEKIGLVLAVVTGPIGLVMAVVTAALGVRRRGWLIGVGRASLVLAVLSTILAGIGGYALWNLRLAQLQHDEVAAASAEFCAAGDADPAIVTAPLLGWPSPGATITESLAVMQAWTDNWAALSATSPTGLREGLDLLAARGQTIIDAVSASRIVDDAANEQQITSIEGQSGVAGWYTTYCVAP